MSPGGTLTASGGGFRHGEQVNGYVHSSRVFIGSDTADNNGVATITFTVPTSLESGRHLLQFVGQSSGHVDSATFTVRRGSGTSSNGSGLPFTGGSDIWQMTIAGAALVFVGGALLVVRRRRSHSGLAA